ncbi:hypothetical protein VZT92_025297 [Zoarces viviparus]|uniref:Uncharacterized protein n=1 Tax=Zoarces viviparus TaxID=48416 RepID=A0AAW1E4J7_ZOAVI
MDGQNGSSGGISCRPHGSVTDGKKKKKQQQQEEEKRRKKEEEEKIPDRVTLKKEIGLLSACTIIIGEAGKKEKAESCKYQSVSVQDPMHDKQAQNKAAADRWWVCVGERLHVCLHVHPN